MSEGYRLTGADIHDLTEADWDESIDDGIIMNKSIHRTPGPTVIHRGIEANTSLLDNRTPPIIDNITEPSEQLDPGGVAGIIGHDTSGNVFDDPIAIPGQTAETTPWPRAARFGQGRVEDV